MKHIAIVGIQGIPANYGGFESLVENIIGDNCSDGVRYTVYCSGKDCKSRMREYKGAALRYIPCHANGAESTLYDIVGLLRSLRGFDAVVVLGVSGGVFLPVFSRLCRSRLIVNIDGLEHRRDKWGRFAKWFLRTSEALAVRSADVVIADNKGIQDYVRETYGVESVLIAYGGDHVLRTVPENRAAEILRQYGVVRDGYAMTVCRIEPENNTQMVLEAFAQTGDRLLYIGNWERSEYGRTLREKYRGCPNIVMADAVYDLDVLYVLRSMCRCYIHGHSAGGTNPSLVEAMFFAKPILAYDVVYNRETTEGKAQYFKTSEELAGLLRSPLAYTATDMAGIAGRRYTWAHIARQYEELYKNNF